MCDRILSFLGNQAALVGAIQDYAHDTVVLQRVMDYGEQTSKSWPTQSPGNRRTLLLQLVDHIVVQPKQVNIQLLVERLIGIAIGKISIHTGRREPNNTESRLTLSIAAGHRRVGMEAKMVIEAPNTQRHSHHVDPSIAKLIIKAHRLGGVFFSDHGITMKALAEKESINPSYLTRLIRLTFLAPDITQALLEGCHPITLTASRLLRNTRFPLDWQEQRKLLGFA